MSILPSNTYKYRGGNYDAYVKTRAKLGLNQMKAWEKEQTDIKHLQEVIRSCGTLSNLRKQADSKWKIIDRMMEKNGSHGETIAKNTITVQLSNRGHTFAPLARLQRGVLFVFGEL